MIIIKKKNSVFLIWVQFCIDRAYSLNVIKTGSANGRKKSSGAKRRFSERQKLGEIDKFSSTFSNKSLSSLRT